MEQAEHGNSQRGVLFGAAAIATAAAALATVAAGMDVFAGGMDTLGAVGAEGLIQEAVKMVTGTMQFVKGGQWLSTIDNDHIVIFRNYRDAG